MKNNSLVIIIGFFLFLGILLAGWYLDHKEKEKNRIEIETPFFKGNFQKEKNRIEIETPNFKGNFPMPKEIR